MKPAKISLYTVAGEVAATAYYRVFQYFDNGKYRIRKRPKLSNEKYGKWMPISGKPFYFKIYAFLCQYLNRFSQLLSDCMDVPDVLVLSRGLITRVMPLSYRIMLRYIVKRGAKLVWDYDDNIIDNKEISRKYFDWMSGLASRIVVAGQANVEMLREEYRHKAIILPTTDRDMYKSFNEGLVQRRVESLGDEVRLIWVGTAVSLPYVLAICPAIERYASQYNDKGKKVSLTVVCNHPLEYKPTSFALRNVRWTRAVAIEEMENAHFGLMPLSDRLFNYYKGGFKLIQYLSIGLPVAGSSIGINDKIIKSEFGFKASALDCEEWLEALNNLPVSPRRYTEFSNKAFYQWTASYSYEANLKEWSDIIESVLK